MKISKIIVFCFICLSISLTNSCGGFVKFKDVTGQVTLEDGTPITRGEVCFAKGGMVLQGLIKEDGTYKLNPASSKVGIPSGEYKVYLLSTENINMKNGTRSAVIDAKYSSPTTTDLVCTVSGTTVFDIKIPAAK